MSRRTVVLSIVAGAFAAAMAGTPASALTYDKLTYLTFSGPVQVPGVVLDAGTYRFHLADPSTSRNVIQVLSNDGSIVYAMFFTLPDRRAAATEGPAVTFMEVPVGVVPPVRSLFYPGETRGYEFLYPPGGPNMTARVTPQPEVTYTPIVVEQSIVATEPTLAAEPLPAYAPATVAAAEPIAEPPAPALPATASPLPLAALGGVVSLVLGLGARAVRRRL
jgi:hypothetical protein